MGSYILLKIEMNRVLKHLLLKVHIRIVLKLLDVYDLGVIGWKVR